MSVASTSINAYHGLRHKTTQYDRVYEFVVDHGAATIAMIAKGLKMEKSTVSARVNALVHGNGGAKSKKLELSHIGKCPVTGITAKFWKQIEPPYMTASDFRQLSLDEGVTGA